jgi:hypothetical protein
MASAQALEPISVTHTSTVLLLLATPQGGNWTFYCHNCYAVAHQLETQVPGPVRKADDVGHPHSNFLGRGDNDDGAEEGRARRRGWG